MYSSEQIPNINGCLCGRVFKFSKSIGCNILSYPLPLGPFSPSWCTDIQHEGLNGEAYPACTICFKHAVHVHNHKKSFLGSILFAFGLFFDTLHTSSSGTINNRHDNFLVSLSKSAITIGITNNIWWLKINELWWWERVWCCVCLCVVARFLDGYAKLMKGRGQIF